MWQASVPVRCQSAQAMGRYVVLTLLTFVVLRWRVSTRQTRRVRSNVACISMSSKVTKHG